MRPALSLYLGLLGASLSLVAGCSNTPSPTPMPRFIAVSSGDAYTCALSKDGSPLCWGYDEHGQATPPDGEAFVAISSGTSHTCALREDGTPVCWGSDKAGQTSPPQGESLTLVSSGWDHTCGLRKDGDCSLLGQRRRRPSLASRGRAIQFHRQRLLRHLRTAGGREGDMLGANAGTPNIRLGGGTRGTLCAN